MAENFAKTAEGSIANIETNESAENEERYRQALLVLHEEVFSLVGPVSGLLNNGASSRADNMRHYIFTTCEPLIKTNAVVGNFLNIKKFRMRMYRNKITDFIRREKEDPADPMSFDELEAATVSQSHRDFQFQEQLADFRKKMGAITNEKNRQQIAVFFEALLDGKSNEEIAQSLGMTSKSRVSTLYAEWRLDYPGLFAELPPSVMLLRKQLLGSKHSDNAKQLN